MKSALDVLQKAETRVQSLITNQISRLRTEVTGRFDKTTISKELEVLSAGLKQVQDSVKPTNVDPAAGDSFQK
jgi:hypothetical protein